MNSQEIRRKFLDYFKSQGHAIVPSSPVVPHDDPTLLFNNAGMNQFKDVFLGKTKREYTRATTSQKCIRVGGKHNDLDNVGHTTRHLTFFEMLGNFSFGDYFKKEAIAFAWELTTNGFEFDPKDVWVTIFDDDDEAHDLWTAHVKPERIVRLGEKDNFWSMGDTGPCGPCSELHFDRGSKYGDAASPKEDVSGERYIEFWNLVFMQFNRDASGKMTPLPKPCVDTGAGLERIAALKMGVDDVFQTDVLRGLIAEVEQISGKKYGGEAAYHVIADHMRSLAFAIADGAQPSNVDRGYVLRKLLRRAVRYGRSLGLNKPFLAKIYPRLVDLMGNDFPELKSAQSRIEEILTLEEEAFLRTLQRGGNILNSIIEEALKSPHKQITGEQAFKLKDTYGLPLEEIMLIAKDNALAVNLDAYELLEKEAKERSRKAHVSHKQEAEASLFEETQPTTFIGYDDETTEAKIIALVKDGAFVEKLQAGDEGMVLLNTTPFYAEKGGQVGDRGTLSHSDRALFNVTDCQTPYPGVVVHVGTVEKGQLVANEEIFAHIDAKRREGIKNHHTATHLLHWALQQVLGPHIRQAGSLVEENRLRFDFNHHKAISSEELREVERLANEKVRSATPVNSYELAFAEVQKKPEIKQFFGDKYGATVRVVDIDFSKELCGGTHVENVASIGLIRITKESSIAAGVRRLEAAVGSAAETFMYKNEALGHEAAALLKAQFHKLPERVSALLDENKKLSQELKQMRKGQLKGLADEISGTDEMIGEIPLIVAEVEVDDLSALADLIMKRQESRLLILANKIEDRCQLLVRVTPDLVQKGIKAGSLVKEMAPLIGGGGGGKADAAQAGGKKPSGIPDALNKARSLLS